jgi:hypothetical protein
MAFEWKLIVPDLLGKGKALRENVLALSLGGTSVTGHGVVSGMSGGSGSIHQDVTLGLALNKNIYKFYEKAINGDELPLIKVEVTEVTKTTLKMAMLYEFTGSIVTSYNISGSHSGEAKPSAMVSFNYTRMSATSFS